MSAWQQLGRVDDNEEGFRDQGRCGVCHGACHSVGTSPQGKRGTGLLKKVMRSALLFLFLDKDSWSLGLDA